MVDGRKTGFNEDPAVFSAYGYLVIDSFFAVAQKAGPNLTTDREGWGQGKDEGRMGSQRMGSGLSFDIRSATSYVR